MKRRRRRRTGIRRWLNNLRLRYASWRFARWLNNTPEGRAHKAEMQELAEFDLQCAFEMDYE